MGFKEQSCIFERIPVGQQQGAIAVNIVGENPAVTTTLETVRYNSDLYSFLNADTLLSVASSSANDAAAGTGARTVKVTGVNTAGVIKTETVTLNGTTAVQLTAGNEMLVVTKVEVVTYGSGGVNAGDIYVGTGTFTGGIPGTTNDARIPAGYGVSVDGVYMVPAGYTLFIKDLFFSAASATAGSQRWIIEASRSLSQVSPYVFWTGNSSSSYNDVRSLTVPIVLPEKTRFQIKCSSSAGTGPAYAQISGFLVNTSLQSFIYG